MISEIIDLMKSTKKEMRKLMRAKIEVGDGEDEDQNDDTNNKIQ